MDQGRHVKILMATYNGSRFLEDQLQSFINQSYKNWSLLVSDDGSTDNTLQILNDFKSKYPNHDVEIFQGPKEGSSQNFLSLLCRIDVHKNFVMLSDQDDIWLPEKIEHIIEIIARFSAQEPVLYGGRTIIVNDKAKPIRYSKRFSHSPSFSNALVQSIAGGNTMAMNSAAVNLVKKAGPDHNVIGHDWWLYLLISGANGKVIYDSKPMVLYRQHGQNSFGSNLNSFAKIERLKAVVNGTFRTWIDANILSLEKCKEMLTPECRMQLSRFTRLRKQAGLKAAFAVLRLGIKRQTKLDSAIIVLAAAIKRL
ncbi:glycosyltransferase family 2 protein [Parasulfitobacter algicola]|uniref:Glycosyltransferase family 2 protein n=1 Tax=Parasulfitobacter algicola TaxID=2614809 RepID=A0ABX2J006_9RHOB|nr:glycosyltransferase family 2 protein [Sulfitobacter algicola]NSX57055.1 glycosyltransferase family 2 protein [Sulfitobacter algicola]